MRWWEIGPAMNEDDAQVSEIISDTEEPEQRSIMRELLGDDADRYEVAPGRWYLPGTPP
jgi:hypothetical protein